MAKFLKKTGKDNQYYFSLNADNGQIVLSSEGYTSTAARENGIASVRKNAVDDSKYERLSSANGKHYFNLKAGNGQVIGKSQMYESAAGMETGIASVKKNAPDAKEEEAI
jgi:uncharacterized protein